MFTVGSTVTYNAINFKMLAVDNAYLAYEGQI